MAQVVAIFRVLFIFLVLFALQPVLPAYTQELPISKNQVFPALLGSNVLVLCKEQIDDLHQISRFEVKSAYQLRGSRFVRLRTSLNSLMLSRATRACEKGQRRLGVFDSAQAACNRIDLNDDGQVTKSDLRLLSRSQAKARDLRAIRNCWKKSIVNPTPLPTFTAGPVGTASSTPTVAATVTIVPTQTGTASATRTATPNVTNTITVTPTRTATRTATRTSTITGTPTQTGTATATRTITSTPTRTSTPTQTATPTATPLGGAPYGLTQRTIISGVNFPLDDPGSSVGSISIVRAFPSLTFNQPVLVTHANDGSNRLFVLEKPGRIRVFANSDSSTSSSIFLDITSRVDQNGEQGLLGLAFDPNYTSNGYFYVYYSALGGSRRSVIARYTVTSNPNTADFNSELILLQVSQPAAHNNHKGGMIAFGQDNMLYISLGDGGGGGDPLATGQNCADMLGNILRINPHGGSPYSIPSDNPYAGSGNIHDCGTLQNAPSRTCGLNGYLSGQVCREIWSIGLRNPWRFSFDRLTGVSWIGDVGQGAWEEIDIDGPGKNFGWSIFEGAHNYNNPSGLPLNAFDSPIFEYPRNVGSSITGGYVYRGDTIPSLYGKYVYGDYGSGRIWALTYDGMGAVSNTQIGSVSAISTFGEDEAGELFVANIGNGTLNRFTPSGAPGPSIPLHLSQTGLFSNLGTLQAAPGAIEYDVNAPLWSDAALKRRWVFLPGTSQITFHATESYSFPIGTALVKHFELSLSPSVVRRLETRVFFRHNQGWTGYTYKWNEDQTDADLLTESVTQTFEVEDSSAPGGIRQQEWHYPSRSECFSCHTVPSGTVLGVRTRQLNRNFNYSGVVDNQLRSWNHIALFSTDIGAHSTYEAYPEYGDTSKSVASRSRAYLAVNCSHCHQPAMPGSGVFDLRYAISNAAMNVMNVAPTFGDLGLPNPARIRVGSKESSVLWERINRLDGFRMPPLASSVIDQQARDLIGTWIDQGAQDP